MSAVLALQPGEFEAARTSFFPSIKETLNHILSVDLYYLDMMEEGGVGLAIFDRYRDYDDPTAIARRRRHSIAGCSTSASACQSAIWIAACSPTGEDGRFPSASAISSAHLFVHEIHHRGQVHAMLSGTSVKPPQLDEFFLDFDLKLRREEVARLGLSRGHLKTTLFRGLHLTRRGGSGLPRSTRTARGSCLRQNPRHPCAG